MDIEKTIADLRSQIEYHSKKYYTDDAPEIDDYEYDMMFRRLQELEKQYPQYASAYSPTVRIGGQALTKFEKVRHNIPLLSLQDVFSYEEVREFDRKVRETVPDTEYVVERSYHRLVFGQTL
ncbi:MAG TPA: NAD-dependent DNA ligase LigA, partial [Bacillota bacterium]|nr:NAD-dependent DNA ligase LigA [Bacillota bacterium]